MHDGSLRRLGLAGALLTAWAGLLVLLSAPAAAHAVLVGTDPAYGAAVDTAPARVSVTFDEPVTATDRGVSVLDDAGERVDLGRVGSTDGGRTVVAELRPGLPDGTYLLGWVVLSADGHTVSGSSVFGVGGPPNPYPMEPVRDPAEAAADTVVRLLAALGYAGLVAAVGIPLVTAALRLDRPGAARPGAVPLGATTAVRQLIRIGAVTLAVASLATFAAIPVRLAGTPGWSDPEVWRAAATSALGAATLVRAAAATVLALAVSRRNVVLAAGAVAVIATAASGHAVAGQDRLLAVPLTALHVAAMAIWIAGPLLLLVFRRHSGRTTLRTRFGAVAVPAIAVLALTGLYRAWRATDPLAALWSTPWGLLLLAKLAAVTLALAAAAAFRARRAPLRLEFAAQLTALALTAALAGATPARDAYDPAVTLPVALGDTRAELAIDGAAAGEQRWTIRIYDRTGTPIPAASVDALLTRPDEAVGPLRIQPRRVEPVELAPAYFEADRVRVPLAGDWRLRLTVRLDRTAAYTATVPLRVY